MMVHVKRARRVNMKVVKNVKTVRMVNTVRRLKHHVRDVLLEDMETEPINTLHLILQITPLHVQVVGMVHTKTKLVKQHVNYVISGKRDMEPEEQVKVPDVIPAVGLIITIIGVNLAVNIRIVVTLHIPVLVVPIMVPGVLAKASV